MRKPRYLALAAVLAIHIALVAALLLASRFRLLSNSNTSPLEILILNPEVKPVAPMPPAIDHAAIHRELPWIAVPSIELSTPAPAAPEGGRPNSVVDWDEEARTVAAAKARGNAAPSVSHSVPESKSNSPFAPPPAHHAGEEFTTVTGQRAVYINESCFQMASPFTYSPNASNNGMGVQTYCNRSSGAPRGDLFDQLPAYKQHHPGE